MVSRVNLPRRSNYFRGSHTAMQKAHSGHSRLIFVQFENPPYLHLIRSSQKGCTPSLQPHSELG